MFSIIDNLIKNLEEKEKIIKYLNTIYKIETGSEAIVPYPYIYSNSSNENKNISDKDQSNKTFNTFLEKVESLNLPSILDKNMKLKIANLKKSNDSKVLIKHLNIANYAEKGFELPLFKRVTEGMKILKSVEDINLRNNNIDDNFADSVCELFNLENLKRIDISYNNLTILSAKKIINALKTNDRLEYLDVSYNPFNSDYYSCSTICNLMRHHPNLYHFGISDCSRDLAIKVLVDHVDMRSLNLDDNKYKWRSYEYLSKILINKKHRLSVLSLKFSTIEVLSASCLGKALSLNKTLVYLNLYSCGLSDLNAAIIITALDFNKTLVDLDLGANMLGDEFCKKFGKVLKVNNCLTKVNISKNYGICDRNFSDLLDGLVHNQTIVWLGNLFDTNIGVKIRESAEIILNMNKEFLENQIHIGNGSNNNFNNSKISEFNKSQKLSLMKSSTEIEKLKCENLEKFNIHSDGLNINQEDEDERRIIMKYNINFDQVEYK